MQPDVHITFFREAVAELGISSRRFRSKTCTKYVTRELTKEVAARGRRHAALVKTHKSKRSGGFAKDPKIKQYNINTPKHHAHGDYPELIEYIGPSDLMSTQIVCLLDF